MKKVLLVYLFFPIVLFSQGTNYFYYHSATIRPELTEMSNLKAWYKGNYGLTSSGWLDASGNGYNLSFKHANWTPNLTNTKNGIKTALFDGTNDRSDSVLFTTSLWTVYAVIKPIAFTAYDHFFDSGRYPYGEALRFGASDGILQTSLSTNNAVSYAQSVSSGTWVILMQQVRAGEQKISNQVNNNLVNVTANFAYYDLGGLKLGCRFDNTLFGSFEIVEWVIYGSQHTPSQITNTFNDLNLRYLIY